MMLASTAVAVTVAAHTRMNNCIDIVCRMTGRIEDNRLRTLEPLFVLLVVPLTAVASGMSPSKWQVARRKWPSFSR